MSYYHYVEKAAKGQLENAYQYTIPLIYTSLQIKQFKQEYIQIKNKTLDSLLKEQNDTGGLNGYLSWLYGRVFYSTTISAIDSAMNFQYLPTKNYLLKKTDDYDQFHAWAFGYFSLDSSFYSRRGGDFLEIIHSVKEKPDRLWAYILFLQSSISNKDYEQYRVLAKDLEIFSGKSNLVDAVSTISYEDFRGWALSLSLLSELMQDTKSQNIFKFQEQIQDVKYQNKNTHDIALVEAYEHYYKNKFNL
jgi:hypothetical protein